MMFHLVITDKHIPNYYDIIKMYLIRLILQSKIMYIYLKKQKKNTVKLKRIDTWDGTGCLYKYLHYYVLLLSYS